MLIYPLDTISTNIKAHTEKFLSFNEGYQHVVKKNGIKGLFRGFPTTLPGSLVPGVIYFSSYESLNTLGKKVVSKFEKQKTKDGLTLMLPLLTSSLAQMISLIPYIPFDLVRVRMQLNNEQFRYRNVIHGLREVIEKEGLIRLYKASHIIIFTSSVQTGLLLWFYEMQKFFLQKHQNKGMPQFSKDQVPNEKHLSVKESILLSLTSSIAATCIMNPLDMILTRFQATDSTKKVLSARCIAKEIIKNEGYTGFLKGITPRIVISCAYSLLILPIYEYCKSQYGLPI